MSCDKCSLLEYQLKLQQQVVNDLIAGMKIMTINAAAMIRNCQPVEKQPDEAA